MEHKYTVTDLSLLTPVFTKHVVEPLFKFVPWWLPANMITLMSNFCVMIALVVTILVTAGHFRFWLLVPFLIMAYATGDCLDGKQARRTKTSSQLGEFLDHYLDIFVNGLLLSMLILVYGINDPLLIALFLSTSYLSLSGFYFEQYHSKMLFFEKIGAFEAVVILALLLSLGFIESIKQFLLKDVIAYISLFDLMLIGMAFGALFTLKRSLDRTGPSAGKGFTNFFLLTAATAFLAAKLLQPAVIMFVITAYCGSFIGRLHIAHLLKQREPQGDFLFPAFLLISWLLAITPGIIAAVAIVYQLFSVFSSFMAGFMPLRKYWVWFNQGEDFIDVYTT